MSTRLGAAKARKTKASRRARRLIRRRFSGVRAGVGAPASLRAVDTGEVPPPGLTASAARLGVSVMEAHSGSRGCCCPAAVPRSEEHTSELQSRGHLVCRLLLETKKS